MYIPIKLEAVNFQSFEQLSYNFQQGKSVLIQGENLSDDGQESNGAGKSTLQEIVYYCILGSSSTGKRDVKLIRRGGEESHISLSLNNSITKETLRIERTLFVKKSSSLDIYINDKSQKHLFSTIDEGNKLILTLLDISAEDIKNFYLITRDRFTSFFKLSDQQSRSLISRFTNISFISDVENIINTEIDEELLYLKVTEEEKENIEKKIASYESKIDALKEQLQLIKDSSSPEKIKEMKEKAVDRINSEILNFENEIEYYNNKIRDLINYIKEQEELKIDCENNRILIDRTLKRFDNISYDDLYEKLLSNKILQEKEINKLKEKILKIENEIHSYKKDVREIEVTLSGSIRCPKCNHEFIPKRNLDIEEAKKIILEANFIINKLNKQIENIENEISVYNDKQKEIEKELSKITLKINKKRTLILKYENKLKDFQISSFDIKISSLNRELNSSKNNIELLKNKILLKQQEIENIKSEKQDNILIINNLNSSIRELQSFIKQTKIELKEIIEIIENKKEIIENKRIWILYFKQFYIYLTNQCLKKIQDLCNNFLERIDTNLRIKIEGFKFLSNNEIREKITTIILRDNIEEDDYRSFSGGERGKLTLSTILAFQELINSNSKSGGLDLLFIDEILDSVDRLGMKNFIEALNQIHKTIHLTTHIVMKEKDENVVLIRKVNGKSYIV